MDNIIILAANSLYQRNYSISLISDITETDKDVIIMYFQDFQPRDRIIESIDDLDLNILRLYIKKYSMIELKEILNLRSSWKEIEKIINKYLDAHEKNYWGTIKHEHLKNIIKKYDSGISSIEIAKDYDVSEDVILKKIRMFHDTRSQNTKKEIDENVVKKLHKKGLSYSEISKKYDISKATVSRIVNKFDKKIVDENLVVSMYPANSINKIAVAFKVSAKKITEILIRNNIKIRKRGRQHINVDEQEIIDLYVEKEYTVYKIFDTLRKKGKRINRIKIKEILDKNNIPIRGSKANRGRRKVVSIVKKNKIIKDWKNGMKVNALQKKYKLGNIKILEIIEEAKSKKEKPGN